MPVSTARRALLMQILAHPDDDLYFMNPDTRRALDAGTPLVCVYLTAGEADGLNKVPGRPRPAPDKAAYASARHQGLRQAYATLLGLEKFTPWEISVAELADGHRAEVNTLAAGGAGSSWSSSTRPCTPRGTASGCPACGTTGG